MGTSKDPSFPVGRRTRKVLGRGRPRVPGYLRFRVTGASWMDRQKPRQPQDCPLPAHLDAPAGAAPPRPARVLGGFPGTGAGRALSLRAAEKVPPPRRRRPRAPLAPQPPRQAKGRGVARRDCPPRGGSASRSPPIPRAPRIGRGAQPVLTAPRLRAPVGGHRGQRGPSRSRVAGRRAGGGRPAAAAAAAAGRVTEGRGGGVCRPRVVLTAGPPRSASRRPQWQGLYRRLPGPRPFLPPPPPARPAPPSRRLLCVPAGRSVPAPARRDAPTPAAVSRMPPPKGPSRESAPRKRRETR